MIHTALVRGMLMGMISVSVWAEDPPNLRLENKLNNVYQNYNSTPTDETLWSTAVQNSKAQNYSVVAGDSLWEISEVVFGDGQFWPKLWSLNKNIFNPHEIQVGATLAFVNETPEHVAPQLEVVDQPKATGEKLPEVIPEVLALTANVSVPEPSKENGPPGPLPRVVPQWQFSRATKIYRLELERASPAFATALKYLPYYVSETAPESLGQITAVDSDMSEAVLYQHVYVRFTGTPQLHHPYTVVKDREEVMDSTTSNKGHLIEVFGEIELEDSIKPSENIYRALVTKSIHLIPKESVLMEGPLPTLSLDGGTAGVAKVNASVCSGIFGSGDRMFGLDQFVVLNKGSESGLADGQIFPVYQRFLNQPAKEFEQTNPRSIGKLRIVKTSSHFATALLLQQNEIISTGDTISPENLSE